MESKPAQTWMRTVLLAAAAYNLAWGAFVVLFPLAPFQWAGLLEPSYPELWQCIGMIVGVYGVAYAIAAFDPFRHWPVVLAGLLGKILGPIGFLNAASHGRLPWQSGWIIVFNDLIWWIPFGLILYGAHHSYVCRRRCLAPEVLKFALRTKTQGGATIEQLSRTSPVLLVFLRQAGCIFCREALADIAEQRRGIEATGSRVVLVHMSEEPDAATLFRRYGLGDVPRISDTHQCLYRAFGLGRGGFAKLFGPKVWWRGFKAGILKRHGIARRLQGDGLQMPGVFLIYHGEVLRSYRHQSVADRPHYTRFAAGEPMPELGMQS
jgi:peroxiredoxin